MNNKVKLSEVNEFQEEFSKELETNLRYSLEFDPEHKTDYDEQTRHLINIYNQYKSVWFAASSIGYDQDKANKVIYSYEVQKEIKRINRALLYRQFLNKLLSLDNLHRYLSSIIYEPEAIIQDKFKAINLIIEILKIKQKAFNNPATIINIDLNINKLSIYNIKQLLDTIEKSSNPKSCKNKKRVKEYNKQQDELFSNSNLTAEEKEYLSTLNISSFIKTNNVDKPKTLKKDKKSKKI